MSPTELVDAEVIDLRDAPAMSDQAISEAYEVNSRAVFGLACRLLGDRMLAEEVTQEVFLRLWRRPDRFEPERGSLRSFLLTECHGRAIDALRSESARRRREADEGWAGRGRAVPDVARDVCDALVSDQVANLVSALPDGEREAIRLAYCEHLTYREVAAALDAPEGTVKGRIRSGLRRMRTQLDGLGIDVP